MKSAPSLALVGALSLSLSVLALAPAHAGDRELAFHHAPIHYQDTDDSSHVSDYLTAVNYDGNWNTQDNWNNLGRHPKKACAYFSVVENASHYFICYAFYHPRDWADTWVGWEHENDLEGVLNIVRKDGSEHGVLEAMITVYHLDFFSYIPRGSQLQDGAEGIDGILSLQRFAGSMHPRTCQEAKGHGIKAFPFTGDFMGLDGEDGIIYFPSLTEGREPRSGNDRNVPYLLIDIFEPGGLWERQLAEAALSRDRAQTYAKWGVMRGNDDGGCGSGPGRVCNLDSANLPWTWDDQNDGPIYGGELALDPVNVCRRYFRNLGTFPEKYHRNAYISGLRAAGFNGSRLPRGWPAQLNIHRLLANG